MELSARLFHCARCHCQVILCRRCDRGNVYCPNGCAAEARSASLRRAAARYRATRAGRLNNADRQRRYRDRQQKVTHHGSDTAQGTALLRTGDTAPNVPPRIEPGVALAQRSCHHCGRCISPFLRRDFLRSLAQPQQPP